MSKRFFSFLFAGLISLSVSACTTPTNGYTDVSKQESVVEDNSSFEPKLEPGEKMLSFSFFNLSYEAPSTWRLERSDDSRWVYHYPYTENEGGYLYLSYETTELSVVTNSSELNQAYDSIIAGIERTSDNFELQHKESKTIANMEGMQLSYSIDIGTHGNYNVETYLLADINADAVYSINFIMHEDTTADIQNYISPIIDSLQISRTESEKESSIATAPSADDDSSNQIIATVSQQNALRQAESYLRHSAFSHDGLIEQLEYEKFSHEDAVYGADNCGADWNAQALKKAQSYLKYSAFSYDGLIEQLEYEKFTSEQATYGADNCGADWNEQAAKRAKAYLDYSAFSRQGLIDQLIYEGFTQSQAKYGVDSVGL